MSEGRFIQYLHLPERRHCAPTFDEESGTWGMSMYGEYHRLPLPVTTGFPTPWAAEQHARSFMK